MCKDEIIKFKKKEEISSTCENMKLWKLPTIIKNKIRNFGEKMDLSTFMKIWYYKILFVHIIISTK